MTSEGQELVSLQKYLESEKADYAKSPKDFMSEPRSVSVDKKLGAEVIRIRTELLTIMSVPAKTTSIKEVNDSVIFEDHGTFYECWVEAEPQYYTVELHDRLHTLCDSIHFDAT